MYSYYMLSAMGPHMQKYLWWKKYLTTFQMVQFVLIMVHAFQLLFIECDYPRAFVWWIGLHAVMFFFLFKDFYVQTYNRNKAAQKKNAELAAAAAAATQNGNSAPVLNGKPVQQNGIAKKITEYYVNGTDINERIKSQ